MGHAYRMQRLANALASRGFEPIVATLAPSPGEALFRDAGCQVLSLARSDDDRALEDGVRRAAPVAAVVDVLDARPALYAALRRAGMFPIIAFDEAGPAASLASAVINPIVFTRGGGASPYEGPPYMILPPELATRCPRPQGSRVEHVFMAFGGSDTHKVMERLLPLLNHLSRKFRITLHLGPAAQAGAALDRAIAGSRHELVVVRNVPSMIELYDAADLAICAGGIMLYELAAAGCPAAAIATEHHERPTVGYWARQGTALDLGWEGDLDEKRLLATLDRLIDDAATLAAMSAAGPRLVDGRGLERCLDVIAGLLH